jgi:hypothetical protein
MLCCVMSHMHISLYTRIYLSIYIYLCMYVIDDEISILYIYTHSKHLYYNVSSPHIHHTIHHQHTPPTTRQFFAVCRLPVSHKFNSLKCVFIKVTNQHDVRVCERIFVLYILVRYYNTNKMNSTLNTEDINTSS